MVKTSDLLNNNLTLTDSLRQEIDSRNTAAREMLTTDLQKSYAESLSIYQHARDCRYNKGMAYSLYAISIYHRIKGETKEAIEKIDEGIFLLEQVEDEHLLLASLLGNKGLLYNFSGETNKALKFLMEALEVIEQVEGLDRAKAKIHNNIGFIYFETPDYTKALYHFNESIAIKREIGHENNIAPTIGNIGYIYMQLKQFDKASECYQELLEYSKKHDNREHAITALNYLGEIHFHQSDYKTAMSYLNKALVLAEEGGSDLLKHDTLVFIINIKFEQQEYGEVLGIARDIVSFCERNEIETKTYTTSLSYIAAVLDQNEDYEQAIEIGKLCYPFAQDNNDMTSLKRSLNAIINSYESIGNIPMAYKYSKKLSEVHEEIVREKEKETLAKLDAQMEMQQKEYELKQNQEKLIQKEALNKNLSELNDELSRFVNMASHDMKEPIRTITSFCDLLKLNMDDKITAELYLDYISKATNRLFYFMQDLLSFARAGGFVMSNATEVDFEDVITVVKSNLMLKMQEHNAKIEIGELVKVKGHFTPFVQLIQNIISNSITYSKKDISPHIKLNTEINEDKVLITIEDNGIGIKEEFLERIFQAFTRLHSRDKFEGSGIGLATCQKIVEKYNGRIWAGSEFGVGSTFYIELPIQIDA